MTKVQAGTVEMGGRGGPRGSRRGREAVSAVEGREGLSKTQGNRGGGSSMSRSSSGASRSYSGGNRSSSSRQSINGGSQPDVNFVPTVANQTATVTEGDVLNFQIVSSDNIVNQFVEVDAPSWMSLNQASGILSGTAPSFIGTSADTGGPEPRGGRSCQ